MRSKLSSPRHGPYSSPRRGGPATNHDRDHIGYRPLYPQSSSQPPEAASPAAAQLFGNEQLPYYQRSQQSLDLISQAEAGYSPSWAGSSAAVVPPSAPGAPPSGHGADVPPSAPPKRRFDPQLIAQAFRNATSRQGDGLSKSSLKTYYDVHAEVRVAPNLT